jgi:hypothetical protein
VDIKRNINLDHSGLRLDSKLNGSATMGSIVRFGLVTVWVLKNEELTVADHARLDEYLKLSNNGIIVDVLGILLDLFLDLTFQHLL